ncbi:MAG: hypothetical protein ACRENE_00900, partial [Polyangiaceae bacterium]
TGTTSCTSGASVCGGASNVSNGTSCGTNMVCSGGQCVSCTASQPCSPTSCEVGTTSCASGTSACVGVTPKTAGTPCTGGVCDGSGNCITCTGGTSCTLANPCQTGTTTCATGSQTCASSGNKADLTACTTSTVSSGVCCGGSCSACSTPANATAACNTSTNSCTFTCNSGYSACNGGCSNFTDSANCGSCGHSCGGGTCSGGVCQPYAVSTSSTTPSHIVDLATDGTHVAWTDSGLGGAYEVPGAGGTVVTIGTEPGVSGVAIAGGYISVTGRNASYPDQWWGFNDGAGLSEMYTGGLVRDSGGTMGPFLAVSSNAQQTCWVDQFSGMAYIECCPFIGGGGGCGVTQSLSGAPYGKQIGAGANGFYWTDASGGVVYYVPYGGASGAVVTVATGQTSPDMATADSTYAYWTKSGTSIVALSESGGTVTTTSALPSGSSAVTSMASDGSYVHFTSSTSAGGYVGHLSTSTWKITTTPATGTPTGVVAAGGMVFWFDSAANKIYGLRYP